MLYYIILFSIVCNVFLLLLSPFYHNKSKVLRWYHENIFKRITKTRNDKRLIFLNWIVPLFYTALILLLGLLYYKKLVLNSKFNKTLINLTQFENWILIPVLLITNFGLIVVCHVKSEKLNKSFRKLYPFDKILYFPNTICRTCKINKPARSKHCSKCAICVSGEDHHCIWLNCCISDSNYKYFDALLINNLFGLIYASIRSGLLVASINKKFITYFKNLDQSETVLKEFRVFRKDLLTIFLLSFCFSLVLTWFIYTQVELIADGMTTNESDKWFVIHALIKDNFVYKINDQLYVLANDDNGSISRFNSINFYDTRVFIFANISENNLVKSAYEIDNLYDSHSFLENLKQRWN